MQIDVGNPRRVVLEQPQRERETLGLVYFSTFRAQP
jgi:hypothetical protein